METLSWGYLFQSSDSHEKEILDLIFGNDQHILNDGPSTRTSNTTVNDSTPDISLYGSNWRAKTSSKPAESIRSHDNPSISIEINCKTC